MMMIWLHKITKSFGHLRVECGTGLANFECTG